ncbi:MAG: lytic murein transglycosylase [Wenzhouxiangellaceae bacterium]
MLQRGVWLYLTAAAMGAAPAVAAEESDFGACLQQIGTLARDRGLPAEMVGRVLGGLKPRSRVVALDQSQPEFDRSFVEYLAGRVNKTRIWAGRLALIEQAELLVRLTREYGVPGHYLVAIWGLETNYGNYLGSTPVLDALATLACSPRRPKLFTEQLLRALQVIVRDGLQPEQMLGSWAGAMGHTQFMPSTWLEHAVDGDGDGRIDLISSPADALASAARYLSRLGWQRGQRWGREVRLPAGFDFAAIDPEQPRSLREWRALGLRRADRGPLPDAGFDGRLLLPMGRHGPVFLVYPNFDVLLQWNRSEAYAVAVGHLADRIVGGPPLAGLPEANVPMPSRARVRELQQRLAELGLDPGGVDGRMGPATRRAIRAFQIREGLVADGWPGSEVFEAMGLKSEANASSSTP